jgi:voltage-gated potassium channel
MGRSGCAHRLFVGVSLAPPFLSQRASQGALGLSPGFLTGGQRERLRRARAALARRLRLHLWFPHVPLALVVALAGVLEIVPTVEHLIGATDVPAALNNLSRAFVSTILRGAPRGVLGTVLLAMSIGLLLRSRFAWVITLLLLAGSIAFGLHQSIRPVPALVVYNGVLVVLLLVAQHYFDRTSLAAATLFGVPALPVVYSGETA